MKPDVIKILSHPKAGRTWTTYLWYFYALAITDNRWVFDERPTPWREYQHPDTDERFKQAVWPALAEMGRPLLRFSHGFRPEAGETASQAFSKKGIGKRRLAVLVRHPSAMLVSYYHHVMRRRRHYPNAQEIETLADLIASPFHGFRPLADYHHRFDALIPGRQAAVYYSDLVFDTQATFRALLVHCGHEVDEEALRYAVASASFDRLKAIEQAQPNVRSRFRRGVVGGHKEELSPEMAEDLARRIAAEGCTLWERYVEDAQSSRAEPRAAQGA